MRRDPPLKPAPTRSVEPAMPPGARRRRLYLFAFLDEVGPLNALYALWFAHQGLTAGEISVVFMVWAGVGLIAEVPSGALADLVDRRRLIASAMVLRACGIGLWLVWPSFETMIAGAALWALHTAAASGTWEALIHDQLQDAGEADAYGAVAARAGQANQLGVAMGIGVATLALAAGLPMVFLGWLSFASQLPAALVVLSLPAAAAIADDEDEDAPAGTPTAWWPTLQEGIRVAAAGATIGRLVLLGTLIEGLFILDEYQPLLARARGATDASIPLLVAAVWLGLIAGGEVAARVPDLGGRHLGPALTAGALLVIGAIASGSAPGLALLGLGYAIQNTAWIISDARLQAAVPGAVRATVSSVRAFLGGLLTLGAFALVAVTSSATDPSTGVMALIAVLAATGILLALWLPPRCQADAAGPSASSPTP